jgi:hypothetical protein
MKRIAMFVAPLVLVLSLALTVTAAGQEEAPPPRDLSAELAKIECQKKQIDADDARRRYDTAKERYDDLVKLNRAGSAAAEERRVAQIAMLKAEIEQRRKQLDADNCTANLKENPDKACTELINELYHAQDVLPIYQALEKLAEEGYARAQELQRQGVIGRDDVRTARDAAGSATSARKRAELDIQALEIKIKLIPGCKDKVKKPEERRSELPPQEGAQPTSVTTAPEEPPATGTTQPTLITELGSPTLTTSAVPLP